MHRIATILCLAIGWTTLGRAEMVDVCIYGATPAGIAAALAAADGGQQVLLVEPSARIGGLTTCGLSHPDFRTFEGINGTFWQFTRRVLKHYVAEYGADSQQVQDCLQGTHAEPKVNLLVFEQMLAERPNIEVRRSRPLRSVTADDAESAEGAPLRRMAYATFSAQDQQERVAARIFIDASYEGDLMAAAGVKYRVGREGQAEYGESLAPETADDQLQGYNFRLVMTRDEANRVMPRMPAGYRREMFAGVLPLLQDGRIQKVFDYPRNCLYKAHIPVLPNGKYDINDVSAGIVRMSLPGENQGWPDGDAATRQRIFDEHVLWNVGLLYFLQTDDSAPAAFRDEARQWGFCKDEFTDSDHLPPQLYVREARRMLGQHVFTEQDCDYAPGDARGVLKRDAIAMGDYGLNCHGTAHEGSRFGGKHSGEFYKGVPPYQVPYGVIVPRDVSNLLVPVAASASHVGFCALRLEPLWMSLGAAAGHAAHLANSAECPAQKVSIPALQRRLHTTGAATIYVSDVPSDHADFAAVQWWGAAGGFHGLAQPPDRPGKRGARLIGQYCEAYPDHAAELDRPLDANLATRWRKLADQLGIDLAQLPADGLAPTRGDFIRSAWRLSQ